MRIKPGLIEAPENDPFKNDLLGRRQCADALQNLISEVEDGMVLCINAAWGSGKSTFITMWRQQLKNLGYKTLMFNAWESDFVDDAMVALLGELDLEVRKQFGDEDSSKIAQTYKALRRFGGTLIKKSLPLAVKVASGGLVDLDDATVERAIVDEAGKFAEAQVAAYEKSKQSISAFRATLEDLAKQLSENESQSGEAKPLILFIDELDRCRPTFAVRVLEIVKHFFSVPGIVFVLALDREQLGHSVKSQYGEGMDVTGYLRRFFDVEFNLPHGKVEQFVTAQFERFALTDIFDERRCRWGDDEAREIHKVFVALFKILGCSARDQERCFSLISLVLYINQRNSRFDMSLLAPLIVMRVKHPTLYRDFVLGTVGPESLVKTIAENELGRTFFATTEGIFVEWSLLALGFQHPMAAYVDSVRQAREEAGASRRGQAMAEVLEWVERGFGSHILGKLRHFDAQINLVDNFSGQ
jgi:hypothetical protein